MKSSPDPDAIERSFNFLCLANILSALQLPNHLYSLPRALPGGSGVANNDCFFLLSHAGMHPFGLTCMPCVYHYSSKFIELYLNTKQSHTYVLNK